MTGDNDRLMNWIYAAAQPFVGHAGRAFSVAAFAALMFLAVRRARRGSSRPWIALAAAWAVFGTCEAAATREHADIRIDLLVTWPVLLLVTVVAVVVWARSVLERRSTADDALD
jgi:hypothetical protein